MGIFDEEIFLFRAENVTAVFILKKLVSADMVSVTVGVDDCFNGESLFCQKAVNVFYHTHMVAGVNKNRLAVILAVNADIGKCLVIISVAFDVLNFKHVSHLLLNYSLELKGL